MNAISSNLLFYFLSQQTSSLSLAEIDSMKIQSNCFLLCLVFFLISQSAFADEQSSSNAQTLTEASKNNEISKAKLLYLVDQRKLDKNLFEHAIEQPNEEIAIMAIKGVGRIGGDKAVPFLTKPLNSPQPNIRKAAAFSLGISGSETATDYLWQRLAIETSESVRKELYLALGNIAPSDIVPKLLKEYQNQEKTEVIASIFQALVFAVTFNPEIADNIDMRKSQSVIDFAAVLALLERDDMVSYHAGYFLARIKDINRRISPAQLQKFTVKLKDLNNKKIFAKLIGKIAVRNHLANRRLLSWLIEQSENSDIGLATEAIRAMGELLYIPQAKIQLGKLQASKNNIIAQTALNSLAESSLQGREIKALFKKQLKNETPAIVVEAIRGLLKRQQRDEMSWALNILSHQSAYVKIRFAQMIFDKDPVGFKNVVAMLAKNKDQKVAEYASKLLSKGKESKSANQNELSIPTANRKINLPLALHKQLVRLQTTQGEILLRLNNQAPYTGLNFIRLVESGYYKDTYFSRVIGNFVAQGGDTIGDGNGSNGQMIREELSYLPHTKAAVGMATSGKDTGDSQFYINLAENIHLDRHYTVFGQVESGMDVALRLSNGDQIISAEIIK